MTSIKLETFRRNVSTTNNNTQPKTNNKSRLKSNSLGSIIGQFKSVCTKQIWKMGFNDFRWQTRFHDHIIVVLGFAKPAISL